MDSIFGIGLPELFFIAILALIILGPERLPSTLRQIARAWGYMRNLGRELTAQFSEEFKDLEDLNPRKLLNDLADEEMAKDLKALTGGKATSQAKPTTAATTKSTTSPKTTPTKPVAKSTTTTTKPKAGASATKSAAAKATKPASSLATPAGEESVEPMILPPAPAEDTPATTDIPPAASTSSSETDADPPGESTALASTASLSVNGATDHGENDA